MRKANELVACLGPVPAFGHAVRGADRVGQQRAQEAQREFAGSDAFGPVSAIETFGVWLTPDYRLAGLDSTPLPGLMGAISLLALLVAGAVCVAVLLSMATAASGIAAVKAADTASIQAETARQVALAQAETARLQAEAALLRSAQEGAAMLEAVRIVAGGLAVAIMAGAFYVILSHRERRRQDPRPWPGEVVDVTPELPAATPRAALPAARLLPHRADHDGDR